MPPRLPEKIYFKIGEVSEIVGVEPYVLRYWVADEVVYIVRIKHGRQQR